MSSNQYSKEYIKKVKLESAARFNNLEAFYKMKQVFEASMAMHRSLINVYESEVKEFQDDIDSIEEERVSLNWFFIKDIDVITVPAPEVLRDVKSQLDEHIEKMRAFDEKAKTKIRRIYGVDG